MTRDSPSSYRLAQALDRVMRQLSGRIATLIIKEDVHKIGSFGGMVMMAISDYEPCMAGHLSAQMGRDNSQVARVLKLLENKGLIARQPDGKDGRVTIITLTDSGKAEVRMLRRTMSRAVDALSEHLNATDRAMLISLLERLASDPTARDDAR
ncbi:MAG: MarR family transcriptional regulator [Pseudomonadota bacterium]